MPILNLRKACTESVFDKASLKMVLGCTLIGLANHALYMHRLIPAEGHVLGLTSRICNQDSSPERAHAHAQKECAASMMAFNAILCRTGPSNVLAPVSE